MKSLQTKHSDRRRVVRGLFAAALGLVAASSSWLAAGCRRWKGGEMKSQTKTEVVSNANHEQAKAILHVVEANNKHWVGDGFYVSTMFSPFQFDAQLLSPFVLLDYAAPKYFEPSQHRRGVGEHPHRGFETVTFALQGEIEHRDSSGGGGKIGPGEVQWMTAASGLVHEEKHSTEFSEQGGTLEMLQLWVNLPAKHKMTTPRYQEIGSKDIQQLVQEDTSVRVIAGSYQNKSGPAQTFSDMAVLEVEFTKNATWSFSEKDVGLAADATILLFLRNGTATLQQSKKVDEGSLVIFDATSSGSVIVQGEKGTRFFLLSGTPLREPVVAHGPFVMNTKQQIQKAITDYRQGKMGHLPKS